MFPWLVFVVACGGKSSSPAGSGAGGAAGEPSEIPADAGPAASITVQKTLPGQSPNFTLVVGVNEAATALLKQKGEGVAVSFVVHDNVGGDEGQFRETQLELPAEGGILEVAGVDTSPTKAGKGPLTDFSLNVYSTRKAQPDNVLHCSYAGGALSEIAPRMVIECTPL